MLLPQSIVTLFNCLVVFNGQAVAWWAQNFCGVSDRYYPRRVTWGVLAGRIERNLQRISYELCWALWCYSQAWVLCSNLKPEHSALQPCLFWCQVLALVSRAGCFLGWRVHRLFTISIGSLLRSIPVRSTLGWWCSLARRCLVPNVYAAGDMEASIIVAICDCYSRRGACDHVCAALSATPCLMINREEVGVWCIDGNLVDILMAVSAWSLLGSS